MVAAFGFATDIEQLNLIDYRYGVTDKAFHEFACACVVSRFRDDPITVFKSRRDVRVEVTCRGRGGDGDDPIFLGATGVFAENLIVACSLHSAPCDQNRVGRCAALGGDISRNGNVTDGGDCRTADTGAGGVLRLDPVPVLFAGHSGRIRVGTGGRADRRDHRGVLPRIGSASPNCVGAGGRCRCPCQLDPGADIIDVRSGFPLRPLRVECGIVCQCVFAGADTFRGIVLRSAPVLPGVVASEKIAVLRRDGDGRHVRIKGGIGRGSATASSCTIKRYEIGVGVPSRIQRGVIFRNITVTADITSD